MTFYLLFTYECGDKFFFFFKQKTAYEMRISDWSSDVCSSDLVESPLALLLWTIRERAIRVLGIEPDDFLDWLESTAPTEISDDAGEDAADRRSRLADAVDELDGILLTAIEEIAKAEEQEMTPARAEEHPEIGRAHF